jgi:hypothetical protein
MNNLFSFLLIRFLYFTLLYPDSVPYSELVDIYVSTKGNDHALGTESDPLGSIPEAIVRAKQSFDEHLQSKVRIFVAEGVYELDFPLMINERHISDSKSSLEIIGLSDRVVISGGRRLNPAGWKKTRTEERGSIWTYHFSYPDIVVRQLFKNGERVSRSSSPIFKTRGPKKEYQDRIKKYDHTGINVLKSETLEPFCTFEYANSDLSGLLDISNAEIIIHHSWESTWHEIGRMDSEKKLIYLTNAFRYPIGFFSNNVAYRVENTRQYLTEPNTWMFDKQTRTIYYYAPEGEDLSLHAFTVPSQFSLLEIKGADLQRQVKNVKISNITFSYSNYRWGITEISPWLTRLNEERYPWMDFRKGYSGTQVAAKSGHAVSLNYASNVTFEDCRFVNLGTYALKIGRGANKTVVTNCEFHHNGGGGILIGEDIRNVIRDRFSRSDAPSNNVITQSKFYNLGLVHPASVGIAILQSFGNEISENSIFNLPYTGISLGWKWSDGPNYSQDNIIVGNEISQVMQLLSDGAGIYTLGDLSGSIIKDNYIHDLSRSDVAIGASINGIFFDQGTSNLVVTGNRINNIDGRPLKFGKDASYKIVLKDNTVDE